jgi:hypothetical protein
MILELVHGTERLSRCTIPDSGAVPRQGEWLHLIMPIEEGSKAFRVENIAWVGMVDQPMLKAIVFLSAVDPALLPSLPAPGEN